jgi:hypothetical protein
MASGEFSPDSIAGVLAPASSIRAPERRPPATDAENKVRRRPGPRGEESEESLLVPDDKPAHQLDDLA